VPDLGNPDSIVVAAATRAALGEGFGPIHGAARRESVSDAVTILREYASAGVLEGTPAE
jgi:hypothetical protein